jgi:hypothetical protein
MTARGRQWRTWDKITNEIIAQRRIEIEAMRRRFKLEEERRQLELVKGASR